MKYLKQLLLLLTICCIGELLNLLIPLPIPGSIYGMIILFIALCGGIIKLHQIENISTFLLDIMPLLFIPSAVGIMDELDRLAEIWWQVILITIITTVIVMGVAGRVTQGLISYQKKRKKRKKSPNR